MEQANGIIRMIDSYTDQIERYERLSTWFAAFSVVCIIAVLLAAVILMLRRDRDGGRSSSIYSLALSVLFLLIPGIITLYLYVFAMNMRKVAMYRGYLSFLEEQWNALTGAETMFFDGGLIREFFSSFPVNGLGAAVMSIFFMLAFVAGFGLSIHFLLKLGPSRCRVRMTILLSVSLVVCVLFSGLCTYYLSVNESVMASVIEYCREVHG